jgi:hypothetical protein
VRSIEKVNDVTLPGLLSIPCRSHASRQPPAARLPAGRHRVRLGGGAPPRSAGGNGGSGGGGDTQGSGGWTETGGTSSVGFGGNGGNNWFQRQRRPIGRGTDAGIAADTAVPSPLAVNHVMTCDTPPLAVPTQHIEAECAFGPTTGQCKGTTGGQQGTQTENNGTDVGFIEGGDALWYAGVVMDGINTLTLHYAKGVDGGTIEVRLDSTTGQLLGTFTPVSTGIVDHLAKTERSRSVPRAAATPSTSSRPAPRRASSTWTGSNCPHPRRDRPPPRRCSM